MTYQCDLAVFLEGLRGREDEVHLSALHLLVEEDVEELRHRMVVQVGASQVKNLHSQQVGTDPLDTAPEIGLELVLELSLKFNRLTLCHL